MEELWFWKRWNKTHKYFYVTLLSTFILSILFFCIGWYMGLDAVLKWQLIPDLETIDSALDSFVHNLIRYSVDVNTFLVKEKYDATGIIVNPISSYIYFGFVIIAFLFILTLATYLDIFWYGLAMAAFLFFIATLKTELLQLFGAENRVFLIILIALFLIPSYYFHSFGKKTAFWKRLVSFLTIFTLGGLIVGLFSKLDSPFLFLANFSPPVPMVISAIFMMTVGYDIIFGFLYLVTSSKSVNPSGRLRNFLIISILYLLNLLLILLNKMRVIDWDILYISPFLILLVSATVGIWTYRERNKKTKDIMAFAPLGAYLYLSMAIITIATIAFAFITGNDPMVESFEYMILYSHLGFGFAFLCYIFINFGDFFKQNVAIYKVAYKPTRFPFIMMQGVGFIIAMGVFLYSNKFAFYLAASGYYNLGGDAYRYHNNNLLAAEYYREGFNYAFQNHRSNFSLGTIALEEGRNSAAQEYFTRALVRNQSEYAYVSLSNLYLESNMFFPALFMVRDAADVFPNSAPVNNNLGLLYGKSKSIDSAYIYLNNAIESGENEGIPSANILALLINTNLIKEADSVGQSKSYDNHLGFQNNFLIIQNLLGKSYKKEFRNDLLADSILQGPQFPYLYNYGLQKVKEKDHVIFKTIHEKANVVENSGYRDHLNLIQALKEWYSGDKFKAIKQLEMLKLKNNNTSAYFSKILGMLLFKQEAYTIAAHHLGDAHQDVDQEALLYYSISLIETGRKAIAIPILETLSESQFDDIQLISKNILLILKSKNIEDLNNWDDELKFQYLHFNRDNLTEREKLNILQGIRNNNIKLLASAELMEYYLEKKESGKAKEISDQVDINKNTRNYFLGEYNLQKLRLLIQSDQYDELQKTLPNIYLNDYASQNIPYFEARIHEAKNDFSKAEASYLLAKQKNPLEADVFLYTSDFYRKTNKTDKAYETLVEGLDILPESIPLLKAYTKLTSEMNLESFSEDALLKLSALLPQSEYSALKKELEEIRKNKLNSEENNF